MAGSAVGRYRTEMATAGGGTGRSRRCRYCIVRSGAGAAKITRGIDGGCREKPHPSASAAVSLLAWSDNTAGSSLTLAGGLSAMPALRGMT
jgi:hypothetical protein